MDSGGLCRSMPLIKFTRKVLIKYLSCFIFVHSRLDARLECYAKQYAQVFIKHVDFKRTRVRVQVS
jgi:hypothetical protein